LPPEHVSDPTSPGKHEQQSLGIATGIPPHDPWQHWCPTVHVAGHVRPPASIVVVGVVVGVVGGGALSGLLASRSSIVFPPQAAKRKTTDTIPDSKRPNMSPC